MAYLDRIRDLPSPDFSLYRPFRIDGVDVGYVTHDFATVLDEFAAVFEVRHGAVDLAASLDTPETRTQAVDEVLRKLAERGVIRNWRDERFPISTSFTAPPLLVIERAAVPLFGIRAYGVHINGFVRTRTGIEMWIGKRALDRAMAPGKFDQMVAGGQPAGLGLLDNVIKECEEEASIPEALARRALQVGVISYATARDEGLRRDVLFNYDLELADDFVPRNTDGEIAEFHRWPIARVADIVRNTTGFKFNCSLVVIDFLIRHGLIEPDHPDYVALIAGLHR
ncbi:MAG: DUF4743 domain-containing protein [Rhodospirillales bacterium]|nr:DUF4743 domain-containing protein [Rhodospirillales bacterium]